MVAPVIANPQGEAIHAGTLDCFTAFAMTEGLTAMEVMCRHREKYAAFQWRGKGKWRFMQPARHPVIANPQGEAIHAGTLDCFTAFAMTEGLTAMEVMCCHREKYAAFQWHGKGKWRFMQPACRSVIAYPQGEAIHTGTLDCFTLRVRNDGVAGLFALLKAALFSRMTCATI
jgi:hypothetical protein